MKAKTIRTKLINWRTLRQPDGLPLVIVNKVVGRIFIG